MRTYMGVDIPDTFEERADPDRCAVVIVDMQNDFAHPDGLCGRFFDVEGFRRCIEPLQTLSASARRARVPVVYIQQVQRPDGSYASPVFLADNLRIQAATGAAFEPVQCMEGTWGAEILDELKPEPGDLVVPKLRRSGFGRTPLAHLMRMRGRTTAVVGGIAANGCVEATVRDAIEQDFFVIVPSDGIGDSSVQRMEVAAGVFNRLLQPGDFVDTATLAAYWDGVPA